jgi:hypothetical protein
MAKSKAKKKKTKKKTARSPKKRAKIKRRAAKSKKKGRHKRRHYRKNPAATPQDAATKIVAYLKKRGLEVEVIQQDDYLQQNREHCAHAPFAIISDYGNMVDMSLDDKFMKFCDKLGYWSEPWDDSELCFMPTDDAVAKSYRQKGKKKPKDTDPACQRDLDRAIQILADVPVVGFEEGGMHQYTWIRMKGFVDHKGRTTRETIVDSDPHRISDLEEAYEEIRNLKCVSNIWYNLD